MRITKSEISMRTWRSPMSAASQGAFVVIPEISHSDISYIIKKQKASNRISLPTGSPGGIRFNALTLHPGVQETSCDIFSSSYHSRTALVKAALFSKQCHAPDPRKGFFDDGLVYRAGHAQIALTAGAERIARQH